MRVLLDTHMLLWWLADDPALPERAADAISDAGNSIIVSAATAWEIAIKKATGRLEAPDDLLDALAENHFDQLPITVLHALAAGDLPAHHSDPFDRMLIAQAQIEAVTLASVDTRFPAYEVELLPLA
jgi:PIN domain nuclease of toxin-antitoxin system